MAEVNIVNFTQLINRLKFNLNSARSVIEFKELDQLEDIEALEGQIRRLEGQIQKLEVVK